MATPTRPGLPPSSGSSSRNGPTLPPRVNVALMPAQLQHEWDLYHATWFTLMGIGGGIFLLARLLRVEARLGVWFGIPAVDIVSFVLIGIGGLVLVWSLGRPFRMLRAVLKPGTSWISRGAIADFIFLVTGGALVLPGLDVGGLKPFAWLPWDAWATNAAGKAIEIVALLSAAIVIVYAGLVLSDKAAITYWRSPLIPAQLVASSLAMSMATVMVMAALHGAPTDQLQWWLLAKFSTLLLLTVVWHLITGRATPGKAEALARLTTTYRWTFFAGVVGAGTVLPVLLAVLGAGTPSDRPSLAVACLVLTVGGGFYLRLLTLRVGYFPPVSGALRLSKRPR